MSACIHLIILDTLLMLTACARSSIEKDYDESSMDVDGKESTYRKMLDRVRSVSCSNSEEQCPCVKPQCVDSGTCPAGYSSHPEERFCYKLYKECKTWSEARKVCRRDGGDLISLKTINFDFFKEVSKQQSGNCDAHHVWVGASDISSKGKWYWLNGEMVSNVFWAPGEPNEDKGGPEDCSGLDDRRGFNLNDISCSASFNFICQIC